MGEAKRRGDGGGGKNFALVDDKLRRLGIDVNALGGSVRANWLEPGSGVP
jgi:hypothetical protein